MTSRLVYWLTKVSKRYKAKLDKEYEEQVMAVVVHHVGGAMVADIAHQFNKFGPQRLDEAQWMMVIGEEAGEVFDAINKQQWDNAHAEIMQTIACYARLLAEIERIKIGFAQRERRLYRRAT